MATDASARNTPGERPADGVQAATAEPRSTSVPPTLRMRGHRVGNTTPRDMSARNTIQHTMAKPVRSWSSSTVTADDATLLLQGVSSSSSSVAEPSVEGVSERAVFSAATSPFSRDAMDGE